jgi:hypothetical protein
MCRFGTRGHKTALAGRTDAMADSGGQVAGASESVVCPVLLFQEYPNLVGEDAMLFLGPGSWVCYHLDGTGVATTECSGGVLAVDGFYNT